MSLNERPPIEGVEPPEWLAKVVNPTIKALLRSPLHRPASKHLMLLTFVGRKTGRTYDIVVGRREMDSTLVVVRASRWRTTCAAGRRSRSCSREGAESAAPSW